jgi:hypothetical protein
MAICESVSSDFNGLRRDFRSFVIAGRSFEAGRSSVALFAHDEAEKRPNEMLISPGETKRFAGLLLSH